MTKIEAVTASVAQQQTSRDENKWLFDFDVKDKHLLEQFILDIRKSYGTDPIEFTETPNGYAVVVEHGFDTRSILSQYGDYVTLKRDDMLFLCSKKKL